MSEPSTGHRERLRSQFLKSPAELTEDELVELLLTYAIPRRDVASLARRLLATFGSLSGVLRSSRERLMEVDGIGEQTSLLLTLVGHIVDFSISMTKPEQTLLLPTEEFETSLSSAEIKINSASDEVADSHLSESSETALRTFANDEIANSLALLPEAVRFADAEEFREYLRQHLPYNSESTRRRRASYIIDRFFPSHQSYQALLLFLNQTGSSTLALQEVIFYHILRAEPMAAQTAENLIWPALPMGRVEREEMRRYILGLLPDLSKSSQANALRSLFNTYHLCGVGQEDGTSLVLRTRSGALDSFVYILLAHFPTPGIYSFTELERGVPGRWLLWDREWMRRQLYNLRDLGLLAKVSEIDTVRQFTLTFDQLSGMKHFFAIPPAQRLALREGLDRDDQESTPHQRL